MARLLNNQSFLFGLPVASQRSAWYTVALPKTSPYNILHPSYHQLIFVCVVASDLDRERERERERGWLGMEGSLEARIGKLVLEADPEAKASKQTPCVQCFEWAGNLQLK